MLGCSSQQKYANQNRNLIGSSRHHLSHMFETVLPARCRACGARGFRAPLHLSVKQKTRIFGGADSASSSAPGAQISSVRLIADGSNEGRKQAASQMYPKAISRVQRRRSAIDSVSSRTTDKQVYPSGEREVVGHAPSPPIKNYPMLPGQKMNQKGTAATQPKMSKLTQLRRAQARGIGT